MNLKKHGKNTLDQAKVIIHTSPAGLWVLVYDVEYFLPFKEYPWFQEAKISEIHNVKLLHNTHLHWPTLDIDLELETLENLENYPLVYHKQDKK